MSKKIEQQNLRRLSIRERHQVKEQFFRLYRKTDNVTESARALDICRRTATRWVRASKLNGGRVRHLLSVQKIRLLASRRAITMVEVSGQKLMLTRNKDYILINKRFPRLTKIKPADKLAETLRLMQSM